MTNRTLTGVGYCAVCRAAVELNENSRCPRHPGRKVADVYRVASAEIENARAAILRARARRLRRELIAWFIAINGLLVIGYVVIFLIEL